MVAQADQGGQALAGHGAVGLQGRAAIDDGHGLPAYGLANSAVIGDEEAAFGDVAFRRRRRKRRRLVCHRLPMPGSEQIREGGGSLSLSCPARSPLPRTL